MAKEKRAPAFLGHERARQAKRASQNFVKADSSIAILFHPFSSDLALLLEVDNSIALLCANLSKKPASPRNKIPPYYTHIRCHGWRRRIDFLPPITIACRGQVLVPSKSKTTKCTGVVHTQPMGKNAVCVLGLVTFEGGYYSYYYAPPPHKACYYHDWFDMHNMG